MDGGAKQMAALWISHPSISLRKRVVTRRTTESSFLSRIAFSVSETMAEMNLLESFKAAPEDLGWKLRDVKTLPSFFVRFPYVIRCNFNCAC